MPRITFKKGDPKPPNSGRKKGVPNKVTVAIREAVQIAFDELGGAQGLVDWAKSDRISKSAFYNIAAKLIPTQMTGVDGEPLIPAASSVPPVVVYLQSPTIFEKPPQKKT